MEAGFARVRMIDDVGAGYSCPLASRGAVGSVSCLAVSRFAAHARGVRFKVLETRLRPQLLGVLRREDHRDPREITVAAPHNPRNNQHRIAARGPRKSNRRKRRESRTGGDNRIVHRGR